MQRTWDALGVDLDGEGELRQQEQFKDSLAGEGSCFVVLEAEMVVGGTAIGTCDISKVFKRFTNRIRVLYKGMDVGLT